jgi:signal transduction histidine kinase/ligand-binding sensor domain-containing protein
VTRHFAISFRTTAWLALFQSIFCAPLHPAASNPTLNFQPYTTRDGLASNLVSALCQDSRGRLWIGTKSGLTMYDGSGFTTYSTLDGLPNDWVTAICERPDKPGALVAGTIAGGLCEYEDGRFRQLTREGNVNTVHVDGSASVWFIMNDTLFLLRHDSLRILAVSSVHPNRGEIIELSDSSGGRQIVAGFGDELLFFSIDGTRRFSAPLHDFGDIYAVVGSPADGTLWLTSADGKICRVDRAGKVLWAGTLPQREPSTLARDRLDQIWVRTVEGVLPIPSDASQFLPGARPFMIADLRPGGWVGPVMFDREDNLWAGTWASGILKVSDRRIVHNPIDGVTGGCADPAGDIWIATNSSIIRLSQGKDNFWDRTTCTEGAGFRWEGDPLIDDHGRLWLTGRVQDGAWFVGFHIVRAPGGSVRLVEFVRLPIHHSAAAWFVDRDDRCWIPVGDSAIEITDVRSGSRVRMLGPKDGLPRAAIKVFYQDRTGNVWIGLWTRGLIRYRTDPPGRGGESRIRLFTSRDGLPHEGIRALHEDADGNLWIGTRYGGLARLDPQGNIASVSRKNGLRSNVVWKVTSDRHGRIWLVTDAGIECIESATLKPLPIQYALAGHNPLAIGIHPGDFFWMVTPQGFSTFEFNRRRLTPPPPLVDIASVLVNNRPRRTDELPDLAHDENHCTIGFAGLGFADERNMRYRYRLLGLDNTWIGPVSQRSITYAALNPGEYTFEVVAVSSEGLESAEPARARLRIAFPYYRQGWFIVTSTVLLGLALSQVYRYRIRRLLELERLRTRIAGDLHDDVGTNLSGILVSTQILERRLKAVIPDADKEHIREIGIVARSTQEMMRDIVWMLNPSHDRFGDLVLKMKDVASGLLGDREFEFTVSPEDSPETLSIDFKRNVFLVYKESLNNIVRHSSATRIVVDIVRRNGVFVLKVSDNGKGFDPSLAGSGSGLANMRQRAAQLGGSLIVQSVPGEGTTVILEVKNNARA